MMGDLKKGGEILGKVKLTFLRLNIANKMLLGYIPIFLLMLAVSSYSLKNVRQLHDLNMSIIQVDMPMLETSELMIENIFAMENFAKRYSILKTPEMQRAFWQRSNEFEEALKKVQALRGGSDLAQIEAIRQSHAKYVDLLASSIDKQDKTNIKADNLDESIKSNQEEIIDLIRKASLDARAEQNRKVTIASNISGDTYTTILIICGFGLLASLGAALIIRMSIVNAVNTLQKSTIQIAEGNFDNLPTISNKDELGDLSYAFSDMAKRLKSLEEMYLDASPLTRLPGSIAIDNVLRKRIESGQPLAFYFIDLDNFKAYNDRYGYSRGNDVLIETARVIESALDARGADNDFIGHVGGDDFVVITKASKYSTVCQNIIAEFDRSIPAFYDEDDRARGYIMGKNRQGQEVNFPMVSISIAVITNATHEFISPLHVSEIAADLKEYAKSIKGSIYVVDRRRISDKTDNEKTAGDKEQAS